LLVNKNKVENIRRLLKKSKINYSEYNKLRKCKGIITWYIRRCPFVDWIYNNIPKKELNELLISLPYLELKALFKGLMEGDAKGRPFTFPIPDIKLSCEGRKVKFLIQVYQALSFLYLLMFPASYFQHRVFLNALSPKS